MRTLMVVLGMCLSTTIMAQNTRINNRNAIGWYNYFGTFKFNSRFGLHTEYQWRRNHLITDWQQSLLRVGINYQLHPKVQLRLGYAWIETFAYGDIPIERLGRQFTEHRIFQMVTVTDAIGRVGLSHRFMLEQRWVGRYSSENLVQEDDFPFTNRFRYMLRMQIPLKGNTIADRTPYLAVYDEIFIGFGKNVNENIFDQNRLGILAGYRFNKTWRVEGGYLSQIVQLGREVDGRNVFQYNNGLIINTYLDLDFSRKATE